LRGLKFLWRFTGLGRRSGSLKDVPELEHRAGSVIVGKV